MLALAFAALFLTGVALSQDFDSAAEQELVRLLNAERAKQDLPALQTDDALRDAARAHSVLMAKAGKLSHQYPGEPTVSKRLAASGVHFDYSGENVAYDSNAESAHQGLMHSPPHRANILKPEYNVVGIGVATKGDQIWVTQDFAHRLAEHTQGDAETLAAATWIQERHKARMMPAAQVRMPQLREQACHMAHSDDLEARSPLQLPDVRAAVVFTETDPSRVAASALKLAHDGNIRRFAVGACFADTEKYPSGAWWIVMAFE
ncbi:MAG: CAP domain-containing protein [Terriglobales bacterium]